MRTMFATVDQARRLDEPEGRCDPVLLVAALLLAAIGIVMVGSASFHVAEGRNLAAGHYLERQLIFLVIGLAAGGVLYCLELKWLERHSQVLLLGCLVLLTLVFVPGLGHTVNGAQRWIDLGLFKLQAVEAAKLLLVVWLASYLKRHGEAVALTWPAILKPIGVMALTMLALLAQPDYGSAVLIAAIFGGMLFLGGASLTRLFLLGMMLMPVVALLAFSENYRLRRFTSFINPWAVQYGDGFQLTQALIAIGRGEWFGVGLGSGVLKLFYLPEAHTDFILAVIAEELGFAGVMLVIILFATVAVRAVAIGYQALEMNRRFAGLTACGVGLWFGIQATVSIGVNLGALPTKGLTLPLISYGGSSLIASCAAVGLVLRVGYELERARVQVARHRAERSAEGWSARSGDRSGIDRAEQPLPEAGDVPAPTASGLRRQRIEPALNVASRAASGERESAQFGGPGRPSVNAAGVNR